MKKRILIPVAVLLVLALLAGGAYYYFSDPYRRGFKTPEKVAEAYVKALKKGDIERCVQIFAPEVFAEHFDCRSYYRLFSENFVAFFLNGGQNYFPTEEPFPKKIMAENRRRFITRSMRMQYMLVMLHGTKYDPEKTNGGSYFHEEADVERALGYLSEDKRFTDMTLVSVFDPWAHFGREKSERRMRREQQECIAYGADDFQDLCAEVEIDGDTYYLFITAVCYDGRWYAFRFTDATSFAGNVPNSNYGLVSRDALNRQKEG